MLVRVWTDKDSRTGPPLILVQCKRYKADASVGVESIKAFWTDVEFDQAGKGLIATTATDSREGQRVCKARKWRTEFAQAADVQGWARSLWRHVPVLSSSLDPTESATGAETIDLMSRGAVTRFGTLARVFKGGQSELLNGIARLAVFYEDLRVEMGEFRKLYAEIIESGKPGADYRVMYFQRRALATLVEFRGCFTVILQTKEFKQAKPTLSEMDARFIDGANKYLNDNWARIKELRNEFAGHIKADSVEFGLTRFTDEVGKITWNPDTDAWSTALECDFAGHILAGAISSKLQTGTDVQSELGPAVDVISQGSNHAQGAMLAWVHAFVWDRFGGA